MRKYEKAIIDSIDSNKQLPRHAFTSYLEEASKNPKSLTSLIKSIFKYIDKNLTEYTGVESIANLNIAFLYLKEIQLNSDYNRDLFTRKLTKLEESINRVSLENKDKFVNQKYALKELEKVRKQIPKLEDLLDDDVNEYVIIKYIINKRLYFSSLNKALTKSPDLVNVRDKNGISLYQNVLRKCIDSIFDYDEDNILYYSTVESLIKSQPKFKLTNQDINNCMNEIYLAIDKINITKNKNRRERKAQIDSLNCLKENLLGENYTSHDTKRIASKYHISLAFPEELSELYDLDITPNSTDRIENTGYTITIDSGAFIIDDALSCKRLANGNYLLGVHIADPLGYFDYDSPVIEEAINREKNIYLHKQINLDENLTSKTIPIFDFDFSASTASLLSNQPKYTRSHFYEINKYDGIVNEFHPRTITNISKNCTDEEIEEVLKNGSKDEELFDTVSNLRDVSMILGDIYPHINLNSEISDNIGNKKDSYTYKMVQLVSVLVGNTVANKFYENDYPCLYRVHYENERDNQKLLEVINELKAKSNNCKIDQLYELMEDIHPRGSYDLTGPNMGLDLDHYCHITSPLRRGPDIVMEHAFEVCFDKKPTDEELLDLEDELKLRRDTANTKENQIALFKEEVSRSLVRKSRH